MSLENFMNRDELLKRLREFAKNNEKTELFHQSFRAQILADFLTSSDLPTRPRDNALDYLAPIIALCVEEDAKLPQHKQKLFTFTDDRVSSLTELLAFGSEEMSRERTIEYFTKVLELATEMKGLGIQLRSYWDAQYNVMWQMVNNFKKNVYHKGLYALIDKMPKRQGQFGKTELRTGASWEGINVVFSRGKKQNQRSIYFHGEEGHRDHLALGPGPEAPLSTAIEMVNDVISRWPQEPEKQAEIMKPSTK